MNTYSGYDKPEGKCGDCRFFVHWQDQKATWRNGTYCGFVPPRVAGIESWGKDRPECKADFPACSMFASVQPVATATRNVRLDE